MQSTNTSSNALPTPLESFLKNNLRVSDYDSIQVVADNAKLPQANGEDSIVQEHLSPSARKRRRARSIKVDRWDNSIGQDGEERSLSPVPVRHGAIAMSRRQESLDRYFREVLAHLEDDLPPPPVLPLPDNKSGHTSEAEVEDAPILGATRKHKEKAKKNENTLPEPINEKASIARAA
eukprot:scaffold5709_cov100-Cylindrotheca_fusiformis.AAC.1